MVTKEKIRVCEVCGELQTHTASGDCCCNGHGGAGAKTIYVNPKEHKKLRDNLEEYRDRIRKWLGLKPNPDGKSQVERVADRLASQEEALKKCREIAHDMYILQDEDLCRSVIEHRAEEIIKIVDKILTSGNN